MLLTIRWVDQNLRAPEWPFLLTLKWEGAKKWLALNLELKLAPYLEYSMQAIFASFTVGISEFKKNPGATLRRAKGAPVAVLSHNQPSFYIVQPEVMQRLADELADKDFIALIQSRRASATAGNVIEVGVDEL